MYRRKGKRHEAYIYIRRRQEDKRKGYEVSYGYIYTRRRERRKNRRRVQARLGEAGNRGMGGSMTRWGCMPC
jgi:hypothetical protein